MEAARKEAIRKFKEVKPTRGVFAVRCTATGRVWAGSFPNLEAMRTRLWFTLRQGAHRNRSLQEEWNAHGEAAFACEILEKFDDDITTIELNDLLKDRRLHWVERLGAQAL
jgi:hypothetical protein